MATIDETQAQLNTHEQVCAFRYESIVKSLFNLICMEQSYEHTLCI
jgi:hypothetical protein